MKTRRRRCGHAAKRLALAALLAAPYTPTGSAADRASVLVELDGLVAYALKHSPTLLQAHALHIEARATHQGVQGFFDPRVSAAAGRAQWLGEVPGATRGSAVNNNTLSAGAGIEAPLRPGVYASAGVAERRLLEPGEPYDSLYQSTAGARLSIPLWRDRGLREWRHLDGAAGARSEAAGQRAAAAAQDVRHAVELAYVELLRAAAALEEAVAAQARAEALLAEGEALVELNVTPAYQLHAARTDVMLRREEVARAEQERHDRQILLLELVGNMDRPPIDGGADKLLAWAEAEPLPAEVAIEDAAMRRAPVLEILARAEAAESDRALAREALKPDLSLALSATWQGENPDGAFGDDPLLGDETFGSEIALTWTRALGNRRERAAARAADASLQAVREELVRARLRVAAELSAARAAVSSGMRRLELAAQAAADARKALEAEEERFRLGESRSRNVLDAQKDLSSALRLRNEAAAALLRARCDYGYASGYGPPQTDNRQQGDTP